MDHDGVGGDEAEDNPGLPPDLAAMSADLFALRGPEAAAYRTLAGEYLVLAVEVELALDVLLGMWFIEMDRELFSEFDSILQRIGLERKLQAIRRLVKHDSAGAGALLGRVDRVQRLRNRIAHQSPRIEHGIVHFTDGSLTAEQFENEIKDARELSLELLDTLFPQVIERRRRWGARDVDEMDRLDGDSADGEPADREQEVGEQDAVSEQEPGSQDAGEAEHAPAKRTRPRRRSIRRRSGDAGTANPSTSLPDE